MDEISDNLNKEIVRIRKDLEITKKEPVKMKNTLTEMKNTF